MEFDYGFMVFLASYMNQFVSCTFSHAMFYVAGWCNEKVKELDGNN